VELRRQRIVVMRLGWPCQRHTDLRRLDDAERQQAIASRTEAGSFLCDSTIVVSFIADLPTAVSSLLGATDSDASQTLAIQGVVGIIGYILYVLWLAAPPALIAEGLGVFLALRRSVFLTAGRRWPVFGLILATAVVS
jgi:hypothetical protein